MFACAPLADRAAVRSSQAYALDAGVSSWRVFFGIETLSAAVVVLSIPLAYAIVPWFFLDGLLWRSRIGLGRLVEYVAFGPSLFGAVLGAVAFLVYLVSTILRREASLYVRRRLSPRPGGRAPKLGSLGTLVDPERIRVPALTVMSLITCAYLALYLSLCAELAYDTQRLHPLGLVHVVMHLCLLWAGRVSIRDLTDTRCTDLTAFENELEQSLGPSASDIS